MGILKEQDFRRLTEKPDPSVPVFLVFGPDTGLVSERFQELMTAYGADIEDPFGKIVLDAAEIDREPDRLVNETLTVSMFGGKRLIGAKATGSKSIDKQVEAVLKAGSEDAIVIVSAGDLKKSQSLRKRIETHKSALAIACYADDGRALDRLVTDELRQAGLDISREARTLLLSILGADRLASRQEVQKLCLYCAASERVETADIEAIVADAAGLALDGLIDAMAGGDVARLEREYSRLLASGHHASVIALQALRHVQTLDQAVATREAGGSVEEALSGIRPPIFFKRRDAVKLQVSIWTGNRITRAANVLYAAIERGRKTASLEKAIVGEALLAVCRVAQSLRRAR